MAKVEKQGRQKAVQYATPLPRMITWNTSVHNTPTYVILIM